MTDRDQKRISTVDRKILSILQGEGRVTNIDLAERIGMAPSPCLRHVKALEADGVIEGYSARLNRRALGFGVLAFVQINLSQHTDDSVERFTEALGRLSEVTECYAVTGDFDYLLRVVARDLDDLGESVLRRLLRLPGVKDVRSTIVLDVVKNAPPVPLV
ncbi:Lrp/AsnC family transcriptional regulator [Skermanella stibiiresistens]|uniref:Lrp/AsnC family transcriptional regulator n=1 Tax=Skermanella stibiiresistens TaxID=913326 RepID=UPI0004AF2697|nr:Lrp/AsnC family transcriptional regulator [Skermanella stibiiresistens]